MAAFTGLSVYPSCRSAITLLQALREDKAATSTRCSSTCSRGYSSTTRVTSSLIPPGYLGIVARRQAERQSPKSYLGMDDAHFHSQRCSRLVACI